MNVRKQSFKVVLRPLYTKEVKASKRMLKTAGVEIIEYKPTGRTLNITL